MSILHRISALIANAKFRIKLAVSYFLLVSFIILILGLVYYQISASNMLTNVRESLSNVVFNNNQVLDERLANIRDKSDVLPIDKELYQLIMEAGQPDNPMLMKADRRITQILFQYFGSGDSIYSAFIVTKGFSFGNMARMFVPAERFWRSELHRQAVEAEGDLVWMPAYDFAATYRLERMQGISFEYDRLVSAVKELNLTYVDDNGIIHTLPPELERPVLVISLTPDYVGKLFSDYAKRSGLSNLSYGIADGDGSVVVNSDSRLVGEVHPPEWLSRTNGQNHGYLRLTMSGRDTLVVFEKMETTGWISYIEIPVGDALQGLKSLKTFSVLFLAAMLAVSALFAYLMSVLITKPIIRIKKAMKLMERGQFLIRIPEWGRDELGQLIQVVNNMSVRIQTLIEENYATRLREKEAELMALNLQLNPHFLYNTLTTMYWIAIENNQQEISNIMLNLAEMLQTSTRSKSETWPLQTDLDWLQKYIYIMSSRFEGQFTVDIQVEEELLELEVPKLFLQPFVENSIIHGFAEREQGGQIMIRASRSGELVLFTVEDNGAGFPADKLSGIRSGQVRSTGMANVEKRIKLLYGAGHPIEIVSAEGKGTKIIVPLRVKVEPQERPAIIQAEGNGRGRLC